MNPGEFVEELQLKDCKYQPLPLESLIKTWNVCVELKHDRFLSARLKNLTDRIRYMERQSSAIELMMLRTSSDGIDWRNFGVYQQQLHLQQQQQQQHQQQQQQQQQQILERRDLRWGLPVSAPSTLFPTPQHPLQWASSAPNPPSWPTLFHPTPSLPASLPANHHLTALISQSQQQPLQQQHQTLSRQASFSPPPQHSPQAQHPGEGTGQEGDEVYPFIPAFHSSYGSYQPVVGPYPRFLTPSPGPSLLGAFDDLDQDPTKVQGGYEEMWKEFDEQNTGNGSGRKDPFEGMTVAGSEGRRWEEGERWEKGEAREKETSGDHVPLPPSLPFGFEGGRSNSERSSEGSSSNRFNQPQPQTYPLPSTSTELPSTVPPTSTASLLPPLTQPQPQPPNQPPTQPPTQPSTIKRRRKSKATSSELKEEKEKAPSKKNRNPHASQDGGDCSGVVGGKGPVCSHCESVSTPLWRRGPDDELLCNACGLYLKLHSKPRPKTFGKQPAAPRKGSVGATIAAGGTPMCFNCEATSTPMWRKDVEGNLACNACSLYYKLHHVVRPVSLSLKQKSRLAALSNLSSAGPSPVVSPTLPSTPLPLMPLVLPPHPSPPANHQLSSIRNDPPRRSASPSAMFTASRPYKRVRTDESWERGSQSDREVLEDGHARMSVLAAAGLSSTSERWG